MKKMLVVDNLSAVTEWSAGLMNRSELTVLTASSADEALEMHRAEKVDLVLIDLQVSGMSPEAFCAAVRQDETTRATSILIACRNISAEIDRALHCKANDYITKPIDVNILAQKAGRLLNIAQRKNCRVLLRISVDGKTTDAPFFCTSQNISATGMLIKTEKLLEKEEPISCAFYLPGSERIVAEAVVIWALREADGTWQYGIHFSNLSPVYCTAIETFISRTEKSAEDPRPYY
ncbi:MAG: PilZ domain-containing protein [Thermodesulfovibrionales bacterium]